MKSSKKLLTVGLACMMVTSIGAAASAINLPVAHVGVESTRSDTRAFSRNYDDVYLADTYNYFMSDTNWWGDNTVTITLDKYSSTDKVYVNLYTRTSSDANWSYHGVSSKLSAGGAKAFTIPKDCEFRVGARAVSGTGTADFIVSLA